MTRLSRLDQKDLVAVALQPARRADPDNAGANHAYPLCSARQHRLAPDFRWEDPILAGISRMKWRFERGFPDSDIGLRIFLAGLTEGCEECDGGCNFSLFGPRRLAGCLVIIRNDTGLSGANLERAVSGFRRLPKGERAAVMPGIELAVSA